MLDVRVKKNKAEVDRKSFHIDISIQDKLRKEIVLAAKLQIAEQETAGSSNKTAQASVSSLIIQ